MKNNQNTKLYAVLLTETANNNQASFKQLYQLSSPVLSYILNGYLKHPNKVEDCLQEVYLKIWQNADRFDSKKGNALTWMSRIARNTALDVLRAEKVRFTNNILDDDSESANCNAQIDPYTSDNLSPEANYIIQSDIEDTKNRLHDLTSVQQECVLLSMYFGFTHTEISEKLKLPLGTIKSWIRRGKQQLGQDFIPA